VPLLSTYGPRNPRDRANWLRGSGSSGSSGGGGNTVNTAMFGLRTALTTTADVQRMVRAAIVTSAAMYNNDDGESAFELLVSTAESVVAATSSPVVAAALQQATSSLSTLTLQQKLWATRSSFDALLDELDEREAAEALEALRDAGAAQRLNSRDEWARVPGRADPVAPITTVRMGSSVRERRDSGRRSSFGSCRPSHDDTPRTPTGRLASSGVNTPRASDDDINGARRGGDELLRIALHDPLRGHPVTRPSRRDSFEHGADPGSPSSQSSSSPYAQNGRSATALVRQPSPLSRLGPASAANTHYGNGRRRISREAVSP